MLRRIRGTIVVVLREEIQGTKGGCARAGDRGAREEFKTR